MLGRTASIAVWTSGGKETLRSALSIISSLSWGGPRKGTPSPPPTSPMLTSTRLGTSLQVRTVVTTQGRSCFQPNPPFPNYFPFYKQPFSLPVASWTLCLSHLQQIQSKKSKDQCWSSARRNPQLCCRLCCSKGLVCVLSARRNTGQPMQDIVWDLLQIFSSKKGAYLVNTLSTSILCVLNCWPHYSPSQDIHWKTSMNIEYQGALHMHNAIIQYMVCIPLVSQMTLFYRERKIGCWYAMHASS